MGCGLISGRVLVFIVCMCWQLSRVGGLFSGSSGALMFTVSICCAYRRWLQARSPDSNHQRLCWGHVVGKCATPVGNVWCLGCSPRVPHVFCGQSHCHGPLPRGVFGRLLRNCVLAGQGRRVRRCDCQSAAPVSKRARSEAECVHSPRHASQFVCCFYHWSRSLGCRVGLGPPMQSPIGIGCICLVIVAFATALSPCSESTTRSRQRRRMWG